MSAFVLDLGQLSQGSSRVRVTADAPQIGLAPEAWPGQVLGEFLVERSGERISVRGRVRGVAWLECVRCLKRFESAMDVPFEVFADRSGTGKRRDEVELERDDYMLFHDGRRLDVSEPVRETLLLELPIAAYCREDCRGLCPRCGADLNEGPCGCLDPIEVEGTPATPTRR